MTALALDTPRAYELGETNTLPVRASTCIYEGAAVGDDGAGYARGLEAGDEFRGFCIRQADNSATTTNGAINVQVRSSGKAQLAVTDLVITSVGAQVFASDDATFTLDSGEDGKNTYIGTVYRYVSDGVGIVSFAAKGDRDDKSVTLGMMVDLARGSIISGQTDGNRPTALAAGTSGQILIGNGADLTSAAVTGDVTISATGVTTIGAGKVTQKMLKDSSTYETFQVNPITCLSGNAGGATSGTDTNVNLMTTGANIFEYSLIGAQTIVAPVLAADGLLCSLDLIAGEGVEYTQGITARSKSAFKIGTDGAFYLKIGLKVADVSGVAECAVGFRKEAAYSATIDGYTDMAVLNLQGGNIKIETILNDGETTTKDTTDTWADAGEHTLEVYVSADGVVTYKIDGVAPTATAAFTFDTTDTVVPFLHIKHDTTEPGAIHLQLWECGLQ
jgi:hypothetical protein